MGDIRSAVRVMAIFCAVLAFPQDTHGEDVNAVRKNLESIVRHLSEEIGPRSYRDTEKLGAAADFIEGRLRSSGLVAVRQSFSYRAKTYENIIAEVRGTDPSARGVLVVGAHYDTVVGTPGADDNASGVAALLELARLAALNPVSRTVRFVAFCLEEPPVFMTRHMGSYAYARSLRSEGAEVFGMISLEMLGYYCDEKGCQNYPASLFKLFYPDRGNFISFVGNISSRQFTMAVKKAFTAVSRLPVESLNAPALVPGVDFSDHRSFWKFGFPAFMITDTAFYRNPHYHSPGDTADTLDYERMTELVAGLSRALGML